MTAASSSSSSLQDDTCNDDDFTWTGAQYFLPRDAMMAQDVRQSVAIQYCAKVRLDLYGRISFAAW